MHAEEKLRKQTKLTVSEIDLAFELFATIVFFVFATKLNPKPEQMEQLKLLLDEELNYSKKKSRNNMKELMHVRQFTLSNHGNCY